MTDTLLNAGVQQITPVYSGILRRTQLLMFQILTKAQPHYLNSHLFFLRDLISLLHLARGHAQQRGPLLIPSCHLTLSALRDPAFHFTWISRGPIRLCTKSNNTN